MSRWGFGATQRDKKCSCVCEQAVWFFVCGLLTASDISAENFTRPSRTTHLFKNTSMNIRNTECWRALNVTLSPSSLSDASQLLTLSWHHEQASHCEWNLLHISWQIEQQQLQYESMFQLKTSTSTTDWTDPLSQKLEEKNKWFHQILFVKSEETSQIHQQRWSFLNLHSFQCTLTVSSVYYPNEIAASGVKLNWNVPLWWRGTWAASSSR